MNRNDAERFAGEWVRLWNARDLEGVLAHYSEGVSMRSPRAVAVTGDGEVRTKEKLRAYWTAALAGLGHLSFTLDHVLWDDARSELAIVYVAHLDGKSVRACERLRFENGLVSDAEALYGA